jgi:hypothetical protein
VEIEDKERRMEIWVETSVELCTDSSIQFAFKLIDLKEAVGISVDMPLKHKERTRIVFVGYVTLLEII